MLSHKFGRGIGVTSASRIVYCLMFSGLDLPLRPPFPQHPRNRECCEILKAVQRSDDEAVFAARVHSVVEPSVGQSPSSVVSRDMVLLRIGQPCTRSHELLVKTSRVDDCPWFEQYAFFVDMTNIGEAETADGNTSVLQSQKSRALKNNQGFSYWCFRYTELLGNFSLDQDLARLELPRDDCGFECFHNQVRSSWCSSAQLRQRGGESGVRQESHDRQLRACHPARRR